MRAVLGLLAASLTVAACGEKSEPDPASIPVPVTATVDLERPPAGPPDAGTQAGHGAPDGIATTTQDRFSFRGRVQPAGARLAAEGAQVSRGAGGAFTVTVTGLERGPNRVALTATAGSGKPWTYEAVITRR
jgi:hypothetical protein